MQINKNNKTLDVVIENASPNGLEKFSSIAIFKGEFQKYNEFPEIKSMIDFRDFYNTHSEYIMSMPVYEDGEELTLNYNDNLVGYIFLNKNDYENFYSRKLNEHLTSEDCNEIAHEFDREIATLNDCYNGILKQIKITLTVDGKSNIETLYANVEDIEYIVENSDTLKDNPEFIEPFKIDFEKENSVEEDYIDEEDKVEIIKVLIKEPGKEPYEKEIENTLENLQHIVGGHIESVEMPGMKNVDLYVNEEGKLDRLKGNFWLPEYEDCVAGTCFMVGYNPETCDCVSLTDNQIKKCKKYIKTYELPKGLDLYFDHQILNAYMMKKYEIQQRKNAEM